MKSVEFCYWLQGYFELYNTSSTHPGLSSDQTECIRKHLAMVFKHEIDPSYVDSAELTKIHNPVLKPIPPPSTLRKDGEYPTMRC